MHARLNQNDVTNLVNVEDADRVRDAIIAIYGARYPGWFKGSGRAGFYSDERYFRPLQRGKMPVGVGQAVAVPQGTEESPGSRERDAG